MSHKRKRAEDGKADPRALVRTHETGVACAKFASAWADFFETRSDRAMSRFFARSQPVIDRKDPAAEALRAAVLGLSVVTTDCLVRIRSKLPRDILSCIFYAALHTGVFPNELPPHLVDAIGLNLADGSILAAADDDNQMHYQYIRAGMLSCGEVLWAWIWRIPSILSHPFHDERLYTLIDGNNWKKLNRYLNNENNSKLVAHFLKRERDGQLPNGPKDRNSALSLCLSFWMIARSDFVKELDTDDHLTLQNNAQAICTLLDYARRFPPNQETSGSRIILVRNFIRWIIMYLFPQIPFEQFRCFESHRREPGSLYPSVFHTNGKKFEEADVKACFYNEQRRSAFIAAGMALSMLSATETKDKDLVKEVQCYASNLTGSDCFMFRFIEKNVQVFIDYAQCVPRFKAAVVAATSVITPFAGDPAGIVTDYVGHSSMFFAQLK